MIPLTKNYQIDEQDTTPMNNIRSFNSLMQKCSEGNDINLQATAMGFAYYQSYKDNKDYQNVVKLDSNAMTLYFTIKSLVDDISHNLKQKAEDEVDMNKRKALANIIKSHEDRIDEYSGIYNRTLQQLEQDGQEFGYQYFNKQLPAIRYV